MADTQSPSGTAAAEHHTSGFHVRLLTVIAGVEIVLGFLGALGAATTLLAISQGSNVLNEVLAPSPGQTAELDATMERVRTTWRFIGPILIALVLVSLAVSIAKIIAGIGLWQLKVWGATLTTVVAWLAIASTSLTILAPFLRAVLRAVDPTASGAMLLGTSNWMHIMPAVAVLGFWILTLLVVRHAKRHAIMRTHVSVTILHHGDSLR